MARKTSLIEQLDQIAQDAGFATRFLPATGDNSIEMVVVHLGTDHRERPLFLELALASAARAAIRTQNAPSGAGDDKGGYEQVDYLQFYADLPFQVEPAFLPEVAQLVLLVNRVVPLVGFGLKESERTVYYRHMMMVDARKKMNSKLIVATIQVITFLLQEFGQVMEKVATGTRTLAQVKAEMPGAKKLG